MVKYLVDSRGSSIAIGLSGDKNEIIPQFYSMWNHGATSGELIWINDNLAFFWTKSKEFQRALFNSCLAGILNREDVDEPTPAMEAEAQDAANERVKNLIPSRFSARYGSPLGSHGVGVVEGLARENLIDSLLV